MKKSGLKGYLVSRLSGEKVLKLSGIIFRKDGRVKKAHVVNGEWSLRTDKTHYFCAECPMSRIPIDEYRVEVY